MRPLAADYDYEPSTYRPSAAATTIGSGREGTAATSHLGPQYRMMATSLPGSTLVVATRLDSVSATLSSLRAIEIGLTLGLLVLLVILITVDRAAGPSTPGGHVAGGGRHRRRRPDPAGPSRRRHHRDLALGRALNGMLAQIETAFALRAGSEERLRSFLADASHELRTPLTSIQGYAELLRKDALPDAEARERALARIEQEAARMGLLVGDLAVLAREGEGPVPERIRVDLDRGRRRGGVRRPGHRRVPGDLAGAPGPVPVQADRRRLEQLVHNLVGNALAHTPAGTPVEVRVAGEGDRARRGGPGPRPGHGPEQAERVFDRFYRGASASRDGGSGLGLFIVASLARSFGGEVRVDSAPGAGCAFTVALPLDTGEPVRHRRRPPAAARPGARG